MKRCFRVLGGPLFVGLLLLISLSPAAGAASTSSTKPFHLSLSPLSGGVLIAQAIHAGLLHVSGHATSTNVNSGLTCSPAPCALPNVQASGGNGSSQVDETPIATNPKNASQLLTGGNDYNCPTIRGFFTSSNGGKSWTHLCSKSPLSGGCGDPGVGYDLNGNAYVTGIDSSDGCQSTGVIGIEKSINNGKTWGKPTIAVPNVLGGLADKDWLQIDDNAASPHANSLYISVTQFDSSQTTTEISVSHSLDGGKTWKTKLVDTPQRSPHIDEFSDLAIGKDGTVYVSWMRCTANGPTGDCGGTKATLVVSKSTNGGTTWSKPITIATANLAPDTCGAYYGCLPNTSERVSNIPAIDIDNSSGPNAGHLYTVMYNYTGTFMQVLVTTSTDGGAKWSKPVPVAPASDKHDQFFPWLTVSASGTVGVTWLDRRNDPNNHDYEAFAAISTDGGKTFGTNVQIASKPSNPNNDGLGGGFMGDYSGNYWNGKTLYASWTDCRNGSTSQDEVGGYLTK